MRVAGIREFRNQAPEMVKGDDLVFVTRHGKLAGVLVPLGKPEKLPVELRQDLLSRLGEVISRQLDRRGVSEKDLKRDFESWRRQRRAGRRRR